MCTHVGVEPVSSEYQHKCRYDRGGARRSLQHSLASTASRILVAICVSTFGSGQGQGAAASYPNVGSEFLRGTTDGKGTIGESSMSRAEVGIPNQVVIKATDTHKLWYASDGSFYK